MAKSNHRLKNPGLVKEDGLRKDQVMNLTEFSKIPAPGYVVDSMGKILQPWGCGDAPRAVSAPVMFRKVDASIALYGPIEKPHCSCCCSPGQGYEREVAEVAKAPRPRGGACTYAARFELWEKVPLAASHTTTASATTTAIIEKYLFRR